MKDAIIQDQWGRVQRQAGQGPTHPTPSAVPALVLLPLCGGKRQKTKKKQKAEQEVSASEGYGQGDVVDGDRALLQQEWARKASLRT